VASGFLGALVRSESSPDWWRGQFSIAKLPEYTPKKSTEHFWGFPSRGSGERSGMRSGQPGAPPPASPWAGSDRGSRSLASESFGRPSLGRPHPVPSARISFDPAEGAAGIPGGKASRLTPVPLSCLTPHEPLPTRHLGMHPVVRRDMPAECPPNGHPPIDVGRLDPTVPG